MNILLYVIMCLIYGSTFLFIKIGVTAGFDPFIFGFSRFIIAGTTMLAILKIRKVNLKLGLSDLYKTAIAGFFLITVCFGSMNWAEQYISSGLAAIMVASTPFFIIIINRVKSKVKIAKEEIVGFIVSIIGIVLIMKCAINDSFSVQWLMGVLVMLLGEFGFAYGTIYAKGVIDNGVNVFLFNGYQMLFGSIGLLILSLLFKESFSIENTQFGIISLAYLVFGGSLIAASIYHYLISKTGSFFPSTWTFVSPMISLFVGYLVLREPLTALNIMGSLIVVTGLVISKWTSIVRSKNNCCCNHQNS